MRGFKADQSEGPALLQECQSVPRQRCHSVPREVCQPITSQHCSPVTNQICLEVRGQSEALENEISLKVPTTNCTPVPKEVKVPVCHTVAKKMCMNLPRSDNILILTSTIFCRSECHAVPSRKCFPVKVPYCKSVPDKKCSKVPTEQCVQEERSKCHQVPRQECSGYRG